MDDEDMPSLIYAVLARARMTARYVANMAVDSARIGAAVAVESLGRAVFPDAFPIGFGERARILELCDRVEILAQTRADSDAGFDRYSEVRGELLAELTIPRVRQLATFYGTRDPEQPPPFAQHVIDVIDAVVHHVREDLAHLRQRYDHQVELTTLQRDTLAKATSVTLDFAYGGEWSTDLATTIRRIGEDRDSLAEQRKVLAERVRELVEERDRARNERDQLASDCDHLRALLEGKRVQIEANGVQWSASVDDDGTPVVVSPIVDGVRVHVQGERVFVEQDGVKVEVIDHDRAEPAETLDEHGR